VDAFLNPACQHSNLKSLMAKACPVKCVLAQVVCLLKFRACPFSLLWFTLRGGLWTYFLSLLGASLLVERLQVSVL
jgi:hypothetical protein